jgi:transposase
VEKKLPETLAGLIAAWPGPAPVRLMFQDEARFGRINHVRRCWAPRPVRPLCRAMLTHQYTYAYGAVDVVSGELDSLILPHVNTDCMQIFLNEVGQRHPQDRIIMVLDGAGWHASASLKAPANMRLLSLPPYAPELNPIEHVWDELREKSFHNKAFDSLDALEDQLETGLLALENDQPRVKSIVSWDWIVNALLK